MCIFSIVCVNMMFMVQCIYIKEMLVDSELWGVKSVDLFQCKNIYDLRLGRTLVMWDLGIYFHYFSQYKMNLGVYDCHIVILDGAKALCHSIIKRFSFVPKICINGQKDLKYFHIYVFFRLFSTVNIR